MKLKSLKTDVRKYYHSSSFLMALLFTLLLGAAAVIIAYSGYYSGNEYFSRSAETLIDAEMHYLVQAQHEGRLDQALSLAAARPGLLIGLISPAGHLSGGTLRGIPENIMGSQKEMGVFTTDTGESLGAKIAHLPDGTRLIVAIDITEMRKVVNTVRFLGIITIILMGIVILTSFLISTFVVSRTNRIAVTAKGIMDTGDLSQRIQIDGRWDDLSNMASVLNGLLARIEDLLIGIRRVSDNVAHDLRTPLTRLRNNLETLRNNANQKGNSSEPYDNLINEADRLLSTFNSLLRIARIETSKQKTQFRNFNLSSLMRDVVELYDPLAEEQQLSLIASCPETLDYRGDSDLLFQAAANLLDNAIKFTPVGGKIELSLTPREGGALLVIRDNGPGVRSQDKDKIFDRFYRAEASRTTPGNGLGLSLVAAVVSLHEGKIEITDGQPGLKISISL